MELEKTCGNCSEVQLEPIMGAVLVGCKQTGLVIPHEMDGDKRTITFWRVPLECPRTEGVQKSEEVVARRFWVVKNF